jgi:membrane protein YdbS with pleckstrin-like domain
VWAPTCGILEGPGSLPFDDAETLPPEYLDGGGMVGLDGNRFLGKVGEQAGGVHFGSGVRVGRCEAICCSAERLDGCHPGGEVLLDPSNENRNMQTEELLPGTVSESGPMGLDPRVVLVWRLSRLVGLALFGLPVSVAAGVGLGIWGGAPVGWAVGGLLVFFQLLQALVWPRLEYEATTYELRSYDLLVRSGVLFKSWSCVPLARIQHVDTRQGPIERAFGLARLHVYTAAGVAPDGEIPGLSQGEAEHLRDLLSRRVGDDGV